MSSSSAADGDLPSSSAMQDIFLEFRAGKMIMEGNRVLPDPRKGRFRIGKGEEGLVHFQWLDRTTNAVEDDQIIFPEEATFDKVTQAPGRIYILKFNTDDRKFFFWMQEPKPGNDKLFCSSVNFYINRPLDYVDEEEPDASVPLESSENINEEDISSRAGNLVGPNMGAEMSSDVSSSGPVKLADLQRILSNIGAAGEVADPDAGFGLAELFKPDLLFPILETLPLEERLASYLPEGQWNVDELIDLVQSPPFRQQVDSFTYVLRTGQVDLTQFGIDPSKYKFTVLSFLEALEDSVLKSAEPTRGQASQTSNEPMDESR